MKLKEMPHDESMQEAALKSDPSFNPQNEKFGHPKKKKPNKLYNEEVHENDPDLTQDW